MIPALNGRKSIRKSADTVARSYRETIDGIAWDILPEQRLCRCKILGSDKLIPVRYPNDMRKTPAWLKKGTAVSIHFVGGARHRGILAGPGLAIPTPEIGASAEPSMSVGLDCVISGCTMHTAGGMHVYFKLGKYRINGVYYDLEDNWTMDETPNLTMDEGPSITMDSVADVFQISAADATGFRLDAFFVGADGQIDYVAGTPDATNPQMPSTPAAHVLLEHLLVPPGIIEVTGDLIGQPFVEPFGTALSLVVAKDRLEWADSSTTIGVTVLDQYSRPMSGSWTITATISQGSGSIGSSERTYGGSAVTFTYHRETPQGEGYEECPVFIDFKLLQVPDVTNTTALLLEDELGALILAS